MIISIVSPLTSVIISGLMFLTTFLFYRRSRRLVTKAKYLIVYPIFNFFRTKNTTLENGSSLSVLVYINEKTQKLKAGTMVRLEKRGNKFFLLKTRFLRATIEEEISFENYFLFQTHLKTRLKNESENPSFILNRSYHKHIDELAEILDIEIRQRTEFETSLNKGMLYRIRNLFNKMDVTELKQ